MSGRSPIESAGAAVAAWRRRSPWAEANAMRIPPPVFSGPEELSPEGLSPEGLSPEVIAALEEGPGLLQLAHELSRLVPEGAPRRTARVLAAALLLIAHQGSTTLPRSGAGRARLAEVLGRLDPQRHVTDAILELVDKGTVPEGLEAIVSSTGDKPIVLEPARLSLHRFAKLEERLARVLARQLQAPPFPSSTIPGARAAFEQVGQDSGAMKWAIDQQWALLNAIHLPFTIISGGPGTGKTTIVVSLLRILARLGVPPERMALAAPTGKAANRIYEEVKRQLRGRTDPIDVSLQSLPAPRTLHRLLGYSPGSDRFGLDETQPIDADLVVVDESSMVDLFLMERLFRAFAPEDNRRKRLVLLGDANQLPSVEAGMVLFHLAQSTPPLVRPWHSWVLPGGQGTTSVPVASSEDVRARYLTTLTWSHRMSRDRPEGRAIYAYAEAIREGRAAELEAPGALAAPPVAEPSALCFSHVEHLAHDWGARKEPAAFFERWWRVRFQDRSVPVAGASAPLKELWSRTFRFAQGHLHPEDEPALAALLEAAESQRVLCLTRGTSLEGAARANAWFSRRRRSSASDTDAKVGARHAGFMAGEPVIFTVNDYALGLFNGYSGVVAWTQEDDGAPRLRAIFETARGMQAYELDKLRHRLEHAYALTVHKAQGSQVAYAALLLPKDDDSPLLVKQLVYTAVSRASHSVVLVGDIRQLVKAVNTPVVRFSAVLERAGAS